MMAVAVCGPSSAICVAQDYGRQVDRQRSSDRTAGVDQANATTEDQQLLREGTMIPPTEGRIISIGRRWGFAPTSPELISASRLATTRRSFNTSSTGLRHKPRPTRLGAATIMVTGPDLPRATMSVSEMKTEEEQLGDEVKVHHLILTENLMLQRIVEAITADSSDDRWTISGEITEFRNQNRLMILTAQRANAN